MTELMTMLVALCAGILGYLIGQNRKTPERMPEQIPEKEPEKRLPLEICRKDRPSIEEQIINLALYNGEDQIGGDS